MKYRSSVIAIVGCDTPPQICQELIALGFDVHTLPFDERLPQPVRSHADMLLFSINDRIFCSDSYLEKATNILSILKAYGYIVIPCDDQLSNKYPYDIAYNIIKVQNCLYGNIPFNSKAVLEYATTNGFTNKAVKQGYAKCSTAILNDKGAITADDGIANALLDAKIPVLKINNAPDAIKLNGYDYGFIGGACGVFDNTVYFAGNIKFHPQHKEIINFCQNLNFDIVNLSEDTLTDIGGIMFFPNIIQ